MTSKDPSKEQPLLFKLYSTIARTSGVLPTRLLVFPSPFNIQTPRFTRGGVALYPVTLEDGRRDVSCMVCRPIRANSDNFLGASWTAEQV